MSIQRRRSKTVLFDTGAVTGSTVTLGAAITTTTATAVTLSAAGSVANGTVISCGTEQMYVSSGAGTTGLVVVRGYQGTTAATHSNGATVNVGGALTYNLLSIADSGNMTRLFRKKSSDINYVVLTAASGNTFPNGGTTLLLPDATAANGAVLITWPAVGTVLITVGGSGAAGPAGPAGTAGVAAPNVTSLSVSYSWQMVGNDPFVQVEAIIGLPTSDTNYSHLAKIKLTAVGPIGGAAIELATRYAPYSGSTLNLNALNWIPMVANNIGYWTIIATVVNEPGSETTSPVTASLYLDGMRLVSEAASDTGGRYLDLSNQLTHTVIGSVPAWGSTHFPANVTHWRSTGALGNPVISAAGSGYTNGTYALGFSGGGGSGAAGTYTVSGNAVTAISLTAAGDSYTSTVTLVFASGGGSGAAGTVEPMFDYIGWQMATATGQVLPIDSLVPGAAQTWMIAAAAGAVKNTGSIGKAALSAYPYSAAISAGFTVATLSAPSATAITDGGLGLATVAINTSGGGYANGTYTVTAAAGGAQIAVTCSSGVAASAKIVNCGAGYLSPPTFSGSFGGGSGATFSLSIGVFQYKDAYGVPDWAISAVTFTTPGGNDVNAWYTVLTVQMVDASGNPASAENGGVEAVVQEFVNNGKLAICTMIADYGFQPAGDTHTYAQIKLYSANRNIDRTKINFQDTTHCIQQSTAFGGGGYLRVGFGTPGNTLRLDVIDSSTLGAGMDVDGSNKPKPSLGYTMALNGSNQIVLNNLPAIYGLPSLPSSSYPQGSVILNTADYKVYRNTTGSAWAKSTDPTDLVAGAVAAGVTITAGQITAGTIAAAISMTSPSLTITSGSTTINLDGTNFLKVSKSGYVQQIGTGLSTYFGTADGVAVTSGGGANQALLMANGLQVGGSSGTSGPYATYYAGGVRVANSGVYVDILNNGMLINGNYVVKARWPSTPTTLADVISILQYHGLSV